MGPFGREKKCSQHTVRRKERVSFLTNFIRENRDPSDGEMAKTTFSTSSGLKKERGKKKGRPTVQGQWLFHGIISKQRWAMQPYKEGNCLESAV